jgi:phosphoglycolate phosphatase
VTHVFFDLDGTLTDPREGMVRCFEYAIERTGIEVDPAVQLESFIGPPLHDSFRELCGGDTGVEEAVACYRERFSTIGLFENRVYDGIPEALGALAGKAASVHMVTSKPTLFATRIVEHFGLGQHFDAVYGSHLDGRLGDKVELIADVLAREGMDPARTVMIGDRKFDMLGARHHGIRALGVLWGYGSEEELLAAGADALCAHPREIQAHVFAQAIDVADRQQEGLK